MGGTKGTALGRVEDSGRRLSIEDLLLAERGLAKSAIARRTQAGRESGAGT